MSNTTCSLTCTNSIGNATGITVLQDDLKKWADEYINKYSNTTNQKDQDKLELHNILHKLKEIDKEEQMKSVESKEKAPANELLNAIALMLGKLWENRKEDEELEVAQSKILNAILELISTRKLVDDEIKDKIRSMSSEELFEFVSDDEGLRKFLEACLERKVIFGKYKEEEEAKKDSYTWDQQWKTYTDFNTYKLGGIYKPNSSKCEYQGHESSP